MPLDAKAKGKLAAQSIVARVKAAAPAPPVPQEKGPVTVEGLDQVTAALANVKVDLSPVVAALEGLTPEATDLSPVVEAVRAARVDLTPVKQAIAQVAEAVKENTEVLREIARTAKATRIVSYDAMGRVTQIKVDVQ